MSEVAQALKKILVHLKGISFSETITADVDKALQLMDRLQPTCECVPRKSTSRMEVTVDLPGGQSVVITGEHSPLIAGLILEQVESAKHEKERLAIWGPIMIVLARMFPMLANAPGIDPWEPRKLDTWAKTAWDEAGQHAARFCLMVWNSGAKWKSGKFDMHAAWTKWDNTTRLADPLRAAAITWAKEEFRLTIPENNPRNPGCVHERMERLDVRATT